MTPARVAQPQVDPRGPRFSAWVTTVVLVIVLVTSNSLLLAVQAVIFAIGAFAGLRWHPYGLLYRFLVAPRLGPPREWEDAAPVRFAQGIGFVIVTVGALAYATGFSTVGLVATALALGAAFLQAAFGFCLGCQIYLRLPARLRGRVTSTSAHDAPNPRNTPNTANTERGAAT